MKTLFSDNARRCTRKAGGTRALHRARWPPERFTSVRFSVDELEEGARAATGLHDFGSPYYREGLERTVEALNTEAQLSELGQVIQHATISNALIQRLKIEDTYAHHPRERFADYLRTYDPTA
ncbi:MAG: hypothetical protein QOD02_354 [Mycobacterium sp.]|jgi:hypothetical protein|nr:hypothetical protein [Mycobacterium sp.]